MTYKLQQGKKLTDIQRNWNIAKNYLKNGPNITNIINALKYLLDGPSKHITGLPDILPGYLIKSLTPAGNLIKLLSKKGTISANNIVSSTNSNFEKELLGQVLNNEYQGKKIIDFTDLQRTVQNKLVLYKTKPQTAYLSYGIDRLGIDRFKFNPDTGIFEPVKLLTFTFESDKIPMGNAKHYDPTTIGHTRTFTTLDEPNVLHIMETLSDWAQNPYNVRSYAKGTQHSKHYIRQLRKLILLMKELKYPLKLIDENESRILKQKQYQEIPAWHIKHLQDNYLLRLLLENMLYAQRNGLTVMRYPTRETVANIEGYIPYLSFNGNFRKELLAVNLVLLILDIEMQMAAGTNIRNYLRLSKLLDQLKLLYNILKLEASSATYNPDEETVLSKYDKFPKMFSKMFKEEPVKTIIDLKGNGWFEINIPKDLLNRLLYYKKGGFIYSLNNSLNK